MGISRTGWKLAVGGACLAIAACTTAVEGTTSTTIQPKTTTTVAASTSTAPATTTSTTKPPPTSTSPAAPSSTTTTVPATTTMTTTTMVIHVYGSSKIYSVDGQVVVQGWVEGTDEVTVPGADVNVGYDDLLGRTEFVAGLELDPGVHLIDVAATNGTGQDAALTIEVVVDPNLVEQLAFVQGVDATEGTIVADYAEWFTGEAATEAAREDGEIGPDDEVPGDFYIRNTNPLLRTLHLTDGAQIVLQACYPDPGPCISEEAVDIDTWATLMSQPDSDVVPWHWYGYGYLPYWLTLDGDTVVQVVEQYLP